MVKLINLEVENIEGLKHISKAKITKKSPYNGVSFVIEYTPNKNVISGLSFNQVDLPNNASAKQYLELFEKTYLEVVTNLKPKSLEFEVIIPDGTYNFSYRETIQKNRVIPDTFLKKHNS